MSSTIRSITAQIDALGPADPESVPVPIYYVNLNQSQDRRRYMETQLASMRTSVTRIEAVDGTTKLPAPAPGVQQIDMCFVQTSYTLAPAKLACTLSHLKAMEAAEIHGQPWSLICEDDVVFQLTSRWPKGILVDLMRRGDQVGAGIIQLYWGPRTGIPETSYFRWSYKLYHAERTPCWGTVAYLVSARGIKDILSYTGRVSQSSLVAPVYLDDPDKCETRRYTHAHLPRQQLNGVADSFLYGLTPTYICSKPLLLYNNCEFESTISNGRVSPAVLTVQKRILDLYTPLSITVIVAGPWTCIGETQLEFFRFAKMCGTRLVVGVCTDEFLVRQGEPSGIVEQDRVAALTKIDGIHAVKRIDNVSDVRKCLGTRKSHVWLRTVHDLILSPSEQSCFSQCNVQHVTESETLFPNLHGRRTSPAIPTSNPETLE